MRRTTQLVIGLVCLALLAVALLRLTRDGGALPQGRVLASAAATDASGFAHASGPQPFDFPADFGAQSDYQTEWWYYTGNLDAADGRHFGYQLTVFRRALVPPAERQARASAWATEQVYMAHLALTDVAGQRFYNYERLMRGAAGLAGAEASPYRVWLDDWRIEEVAPGVRRLVASEEGIALDLTLTDRKGPIAHGIEGYSQKGPDPANASYYYSLTRLDTAGTVTLDGQTYQVNGLSWMDHEYSTSALGPEQVGWDWFALQLDDGTELMLFQIRRSDGSVDPLSGGTLIEDNGRTRRLTHADFTIEVDSTWRSPHTGATYPARWTVQIPSRGLVLRMEPHLPDQELNVSYAYWEGAVRIEGERDGAAVQGNGYIELTGYAASMQGEF